MGAKSYLTTSTLPLREFIPQYGIFVKNGDGGTYIKIKGWGYKLSDQFFSAPLRNYAPLWYICHD